MRNRILESASQGSGAGPWATEAAVRHNQINANQINAAG
jgi:hypothetical protein